mmetsp:Transcript_96969/g.263381  ORF Transcript_96969/g.263381 Transcript_96969/m.263381 type:complete len:109 (+) Transcript_96969:101-427(+)
MATATKAGVCTSHLAQAKPNWTEGVWLVSGHRRLKKAECWRSQRPNSRSHAWQPQSEREHRYMTITAEEPSTHRQWPRRSTIAQTAKQERMWRGQGEEEQEEEEEEEE